MEKTDQVLISHILVLIYGWGEESGWDPLDMGVLDVRG